MKISPVDNNPTKYCSLKRQNKEQTSSTYQNSFLGLYKIYSKQIILNPIMLQKIYNVNPSILNIVGKLPSDITRALQRTGKLDNTGQAIKQTMKAFSKSFEKLNELEDRFVMQQTANFNPEKFINSLQETKNLDYRKLLDSYFKISNAPRELIEKYENEASDILQKAFIALGIIPNNSRVTIKYNAAGRYGNIYNVSFLDEFGKKIFHDKTIKIYKNNRNIIKSSAAMLQSVSEFCNKQSSNNPIKQLFSNFSYTDYMQNSMKALSCASDLHGLYAEANRAMYIKRKFGSTNFIEPHLFDLNNRAGLFETADKELPPMKKTADLKKFGLECFDDTKTVYGRIVDYGGITTEDYLHKLMTRMFNIRIE